MFAAIVWPAWLIIWLVTGRPEPHVAWGRKVKEREHRLAREARRARGSKLSDAEAEAMAATGELDEEDLKEVTGQRD